MSQYKLYVTYKYGSKQRDNYSIVEGDDVKHCYEQIRRVCGNKYAFAYPEHEALPMIVKFGLLEIPLQAQEPREYLEQQQGCMDNE